MVKGPDDLDVLTSVMTEPEAAIIIDALEHDGVDARAVGGLTSGLRAEAPGEVRILVRHGDVERARELLDKYRQGLAEIDWSQVDLGELE